MIEFYAREEHFKAHMEPIFDKIVEAGYPAKWVTGDQSGDKNCRFAVAASSGDLARATRDKKMVFFMEHGAGQSYSVRHESYAGGPKRDNVCMFLSPGPHVTAQNSKFYPTTPSVDIGVPKLDKWHISSSPEKADPLAAPVVAVSFHWDCRVCPETRSGFEHFKNSVLELAAMNSNDPLKPAEFKIVGHCHPRARRTVKKFFLENNIEFYDEFEDILRIADIYACDNSSTIFEFASAGKPVIILNPPFYRKHVTHGLRFWKYADIGPNAKDTKTFLEAIRDCINETREDKLARKSMINEIYYACDGQAAERAAEAILSHMEETNRIQSEGNYIKCLRHSLGVFGILQPGQTVIVFPGYAIINDSIGNFKRRMSFSESEDPSRRIRRVLKTSPKNYQLVEPTIDLTIEDDQDDYNFSARLKKSKGFTEADRDMDAQELYILQEIKKGQGKTQICYHSQHLGDDFKREPMLRAWSRLESQEIIVPGNGQFLWEINTVGSYKG